jgi:exodeoxyribonuclease VIII
MASRKKTRKDFEMSKSYFDIDAVSATLLKSVIKQSPVHAEERMKSFVPTANMKLGTAFHAAILEGEEWDELIAVSPMVDRRTKAGKEAHAKFLETVADKTVITPDQCDLMEAMQTSCLAHPEVQLLFEKCYATEMQIEFEFDGIDCKAMIDMVDDKGTIVDIKTTQDASPEAFMKQSANLHYHLQLAWYARAMNLDLRDVNAYIIAVENTAPHGVAVYRFSQSALLNGWELCKHGVKLWKDYKLNKAIGEDSLPYTDGILELELPVWATNSMEELSK